MSMIAKTMCSTVVGAAFGAAAGAAFGPVGAAAGAACGAVSGATGGTTHFVATKILGDDCQVGKIAIIAACFFVTAGITMAIGDIGFVKACKFTGIYTGMIFGVVIFGSIVLRSLTEDRL